MSHGPVRSGGVDNSVLTVHISVAPTFVVPILLKTSGIKRDERLSKPVGGEIFNKPCLCMSITMPDRVRAALAWAVDSYVLFVALGVLLGLAVAPAALLFSTGPDGTVAVVPIQGTIDGQQSAEYQQMLSEAQADADAVVIVANSGGGAAAASEEMYMQTVRTSEQTPVVAAVDGAALSGAYFAIAPADEMYVKPASFVGSVGVLAEIPQDVEPNDIVGATGPNKLTGFEERQFFNTLETTKNGFVGAVMEHRGDSLEIDEDDVASATVFGGANAVENGMADGVGDRQMAIQAAADRAGLDNPEVEVITPGNDDQTSAEYALSTTYHAGDADEKHLEPIATPDTPRQGALPTLLMAHPATVEASTEPVVTMAPDEDHVVVPIEDTGSPTPETETATQNETAVADDENPSLATPEVVVG